MIVSWHEPRYTWSTVRHTDLPVMAPIYDLVKAQRRAIILNGHEHNYQRLAEDGADGVREFITGADGAPLYPVNPNTSETRPALQAFDDHEFGVLHVMLRPTGYD